MEKSIAARGLYSLIDTYIVSCTKEFELIPEERKEILRKLALYIQEKKKADAPVKLIFICTHNSRRSHLSQLWAQALAYYYGIQGIKTYSGGTEATAFNERAVKALQKAGFQINKSGNTDNPLYMVKFAAETKPVQVFSKVYDKVDNPTEGFAAIMTCSQADEACPFIPGADARIAISYDDPKTADDTPQEAAVYDERTRQIAREMVFVFSLIKH
jgi:hypothetical protein